MAETLSTDIRQFSDAGNAVGARAKDLGRKAADKGSETRGSATQGLESAASTIHEKADRLPDGEMIHSMAHSAAD